MPLARSAVLLASLATILLLPSTSAAGAGAPTEGERQLLHLYGQKALASTGIDWPLEPGITAHAIFEGDRLAALQVSLAAVDEDGDAQARCGISKTRYERLLGLASRFRPIGDALGDAPIGVIGPSGWTTRSSEYANARVVRFETTCTDTGDACGVARFTVFYWISTQGEVTARRAEDITLPASLGQALALRRHVLRIGGIDVEVSEADYSHVQDGDCARVEWLLTNSLARLFPCSTHEEYRRR